MRYLKTLGVFTLKQCVFGHLFLHINLLSQSIKSFNHNINTASKLSSSKMLNSYLITLNDYKQKHFNLRYPERSYLVTEA